MSGQSQLKPVSDQPLRLAIVGCGWAGARHAQACAAAGDALTWAIDTDTARAEQLRALHPQARVAADYVDALRDPSLEAVIICLPHHLHAPVAIACLAAGKHVLVEKPLATTLAEADAMIAAAQSRNLTLMVAENVRYDPLYETIRDLLRGGIIGEVALVQRSRQAYLRESFLGERRWFLQEHAAGGGIMLSGGIHDVELLRMLVGEIASVHALRARQRLPEMEGDDTSVALLRFVTGAVGVLVESFMAKSLATAAGAEVHTLRLDGELGSLESDGGQTIRVFTERPEHRLHGGPVEHTIHVPEGDSFVRQLAHFVSAVRSGAEPLTSGRSQRRPLEVVLAAYRSMATGLPVSCAPPQGGTG